MNDAVADPFLVSLGFEEKDCIEALIQTNGNVSEAAVWLTDNRALGGQQEQTGDVALSTQNSPSVSNSSADGPKTTSVDQTSAQWTAATSSIQNDYNHMTEDEQLTQALALSLEGEASVPDKGKLTDSKEDDPKEPATKSVKLNNDEPFEYLQQLINVFPNVSHQFLSQKAKEFEKKGDYFLQEWVWEVLSSGLEATFPTRDGVLTADPGQIEPGYTSQSLTFNRLFNPDDSMEATARMISDHFFRMCKMYKERPGADLKTWRIKNIELVENLYLKEKYDTRKTEFASLGVPDKAMLVYHGTDPKNAESICKFNLNIRKREAHGAGFYFSEYPQVSFGYGKQLIVFKAMPGREYTGHELNKHDGTDRNAAHHSKKINFNGSMAVQRPKNNPDEHGDFIIIRNSNQFIPFAILHTEEVPINAAVQRVSKSKTAAQRRTTAPTATVGSTGSYASTPGMATPNHYPYYTAAYNSGQTGSTPAAAGSSTANYGTNYGYANYGFATTPSQAPTANRKRSR